MDNDRDILTTVERSRSNPHQMSTIASPRPSIASLTTDSSSRRPSFDGPLQSPRLFEFLSSPLLTGSQRRNRVALRDYYKLTKNPATFASEASTPLHDDELAGAVPESELDVAGFDAEGYVKGILVKEGLEGLLRIERVLVNEIKALDGERKALVYDNYSKLITATDTIRKVLYIPLISVSGTRHHEFLCPVTSGS